jgi:hypothetical protein
MPASTGPRPCGSGARCISCHASSPASAVARARDSSSRCASKREDASLLRPRLAHSPRAAENCPPKPPGCFGLGCAPPPRLHAATHCCCCCSPHAGDLAVGVCDACSCVRYPPVPPKAKWPRCRCQPARPAWAHPPLLCKQPLQRLPWPLHALHHLRPSLLPHALVPVQSAPTCILSCPRSISDRQRLR